MNKKYGLISFLVFLGVVMLIITIHNFDRYYISKNYLLYTFIDCDPILNSCFKITDQAIADVTPQTGPYAKVEVLAKDAPQCLHEHNCSYFSCALSAAGTCNITFCSEDTKEEWEMCVSGYQ